MYIFRWLMKHPLIILALYLLCIAAILNSMTSSKSKTEVSEIDSAEAIVDLSDAPAIEPSNLTSALVEGKSSEKPKNTEVNQADVIENGSIETTTEAVDTNIATSTQFNEMDTDELLLMAREAYWNNGLEESAEIYRQLISFNPDVIDYKGELGNVYWRQGFAKRAAALYADISLPMIESGETARVANMVGFIGLFFPERATEIHNVLEARK